MDVCIRAVSAAAAVAAFKTSSTVYSGFTLSTIDGIQQACPKTYRVENAPVSNTPTDPSQFADPCQGLYILKPNVTVPGEESVKKSLQLWVGVARGVGRLEHLRC